MASEDRPTSGWVAQDKPKTEDMDPDSADLTLKPATDYRKPKETK